MTVNQSVELMVYGLAVLGLNLVVHRMAPDSAGGTLIPLVAGGGLITVLGAAGLRGASRRSWALATLGVVAGLLLVRGVRAWFAVQAGVDEMKLVAGIFSLLLFFGMTQLQSLARPECPMEAKVKGRADHQAESDGTKHDV